VFLDITIRIGVINEETNSLYGTNIKTQFSHIIYIGRSCSFLTSAAIMGHTPYISGPCSLFFRFGGGRPLHNVQTFIFRMLMQNSTARFAISSPITKRSCSFKSRPLMLLLHSAFAPRPFLNVRPFWVPCTTRPCLVPDDRVPHAMQERHGGPTVLGQRPTSSGTYHCPGSTSSVVSGALRLDAGPHTASSVL
jgi:hypothetical protein